MDKVSNDQQGHYRAMVQHSVENCKDFKKWNNTLSDLYHIILQSMVLLSV